MAFDIKASNPQFRNSDMGVTLDGGKMGAMTSDLGRALRVVTLTIGVGAIILPGGMGPVSAAAPPDKTLLAAVERMADLFATRLAVSGGFIWAYSADLAIRRGEGGTVEDGVVWNQPPGTPAVGGAFLQLYELTGNPRWMQAAGAAAQAMLDLPASAKRLLEDKLATCRLGEAGGLWSTVMFS